MKKWIEIGLKEDDVIKRVLLRKEDIVEIEELKRCSHAVTVINIKKPDGGLTSIYALSDYDEIKAALVNNEEWAEKTAKRAIHELQLIVGSEGTTAEIYKAFERRLTEILKSED